MKAVFVALSLVLFVLPVAASDAPAPIYLQAWIGALATDSQSWKVSSGRRLDECGHARYGGRRLP